MSKQISIFDVIDVKQIKKKLYYQDLPLHHRINLKANNRPFSKIFYNQIPLHQSHYRNDFDNLDKWRIHISLDGNKRSAETLIFNKYAIK